MLSKEELDSLNKWFEDKEPLEVLKWGIEKFHPKIVLACSLQAEDLVILDMLSKVVEKPKVFIIDTGRLHQESYELIEEINKKYNTDLRIYFPDYKEVEALVNKHGINLFYRSVELRKACCEVRKVLPLRRALEGMQAWITGLRREQNFTRGGIKKIEIDEVNGGIVKLNPLADWTWEQVWEYIKKNNVPYNKLYDKGYKSIGCVPCTRPVKPWEHPRAGRWWWEQNSDKECGLHYRGVK
ncbi:adenylylsulfate reductase, thioredoxin dependent [Sulfolobus islandicus Y.G.57.14]|jgi:phosphoadenosine phosphosulfate reductase|uniref:Adenosine 5'-phosphosulfate reductase n=6 Tax=Saccharolobus islandicus TaxID=43080 RepID=M9U9J4_SACIS|nr:phosphoadenylyl-sulfate reductase [Sulfolobus islandicus]ACP36541.1 adenylylsulfate reductase, thioredoxin dependent [Sulfolobus islandicus L.S.2.15]ACP46796.1 adenylylsulfate reductase, thioredoxin dependent [Sulfolobus islandicus Y.G.57.14]ACP47516.1 adenylylsulfate reductase, thioredox independent [Sulfolobus islandicus Y.N.15.51]ACP56343.1 adenylylsulfate reductase, thioredoxin dependent [Sulfolobus islandicus M.16.27]ADX86360.1 adenylylsulfate reductase, thioredoxin dependent [Sulfolob